ncbi:MAG: hypothetical protein ING26_17030 [Roseomonas sp.]|nr:hypothetical protein [Roseomonas sp.]MCA3299242.1 hypothetical protein [Roseomonas sp.]
MHALSNRPTLEALRHMQMGDIIALPAEHLALLQSDAREAADAAKRMQAWIESAIGLRYQQRAIAARGMAGKDTGTVRFQDGSVEVTAELSKKIEWDQARLARLAEEIRTDGENPLDYLEIAFKVPERAYTAWPERIRKAFEPARTVQTGRPTYRLTLLSETAQRDARALAGPHPSSEGSN